MKSNKLTVAVLIFASTMSGCIAGGDTDKVQDKFKKANDKVVLKSSVKHKLPSKKKYPRKDSKKGIISELGDINIFDDIRTI